MRHIAIYTRVSTNAQDTASQEPELKRWAAGQNEPVQWYSDKATGRNMDRPGFVALYEAVQRGEVSTVAVWRIDRLGRTAKGLTALFEDLRERRVNLVSLKDSLDLSTPAGRLMANVLASVACFETEVRAERIVAGMQAARAAGRKLGGGKAGRLVVVRPDQIPAAQEMRAAGKSVSLIARTLGLSRPTIYSILARK